MNGHKEVATLEIGETLEKPGSVLSAVDIGERVREIRQDQGWTLDEASRRTGLARSTISKIENNQMSPTFDVLQKLTLGYNLNLIELFVTNEPSAVARRIITRAGEGRPHESPTYRHEFLCADIARKRMVPFKSRILARSIKEFPTWSRHGGEEFLYVLSGRITVHTEFYEPAMLAEGDSIYFDSRMGHACVTAGDQDAVVLWVCAN